MTEVVNVRRDEFDVYIGRRSVVMVGSKREHLVDEGWGNPFAIGHDGTREEVIEKYRAWILEQPALLARLPELRDKRLGCWCAPKACHGDVLAALAEGMKP